MTGTIKYLFLLILLLPACSGKKAGQLFFRDIINEQYDFKSLTAESVKDIMSSDESINEFSGVIKPYIAFVSYTDGVKKASVSMCSGKADLSYIISESLSSESKLCKYIKLDIVSETQDMGAASLSSECSGLDLGFDGLAFEYNNITFFLMPSEIELLRLIEDSRLDISKIKRYLKKDSHRMRSLKKLLKHEGKVKKYFFKVKSFFIEDGTAIPIYRSHRIIENPTAEYIKRSAVMAGNYLERSVKPDGSFAYIYDPDTDSEPDDYNIVRHAGAISAMMDLYALTKDERLLESAKRAIKYLMTYVLPSKRDGIYKTVVENRVVTLGGNALTVLALAKYMDMTGDITYLYTARLIALHIQTLQSAETGDFIHFYTYDTSLEDTENKCNFYPGEAALALAYLYRVDKMDTYLDTAERAIDYIIHTRDREKLRHDHWLMYAMNELYRHRAFKINIPYIKNLLDSNIKFQQSDTDKYLDYVGSCGYPPTSNPTACRSEGLAALYFLLNALDFSGKDKVQKDIMGFLNKSITYQLGLQFTPETVIYYNNQMRTLGGIRESFWEPFIRIDTVQHNLSSIVSYYRILKNASLNENKD